MQGTARFKALALFLSAVVLCGTACGFLNQIFSGFGGGAGFGGAGADSGGRVIIELANVSGVAATVDVSFTIGPGDVRHTTRRLDADGLFSSTRLLPTRTTQVVVTANAAEDAPAPTTSLIHAGDLLCVHTLTFEIDFHDGDTIQVDITSPEVPPAQIIDCNSNGIADDLDIAGGVSSDCNGNTVPDECDLATGTSHDCNSNDIPDECDIAAGRSTHFAAARHDPRALTLPPIRVLWWDSTPVWSNQSPDALRQAMSDFLTNFGGGGIFLSTYVSSETPGTLAPHLTTHSYDVIVFDATSDTVKFNAGDQAAVQNFFAGHRNLLLDGVLWIRSCTVNSTSVFPGINGSSGSFTANEVFQLAVHGGGIMVGTDHNCCQADANQIVTACIPTASFSGNTTPSLDGQFNGTDLLNAVAVASPFDIFTHWSSIPSEGVPPTGTFNDFQGIPITLFSQVDVADAPGGGPKFSYVSTNWAPSGTGPAFDCNSNGVLDSQDIINGTSQDCDSNGIPDECDPDCNDNGVPDACDIAAHTEADCNGNGVPDRCDISAGTSKDLNDDGIPDECVSGSADCDSNGVPDECERAACTGQPACEDCNENGVLDECDIANGPSKDCNSNGVPDECDVARGTSQDANDDGVPDECQPPPDSDDDGVPDATDNCPNLANPGQEDCDSDGTGDACTIATCTSQPACGDCNENNIPDGCDIASGTSQDCNGNGIPDECDIASCQGDPACGDCNENNIPDGCELVGPTALLGPTPYLCRSDSPFDLSGLGVTFFLENFEDGQLNTPGVSASTGGVVGPGGITDSVDCDDGVTDGSGTNGRSFFSGSGSVGITFTFNPGVLGGYPTRAGVVWTDGAGTITFQAFDAQGQSLGTVTGNHADGGFGGGTAEDRFYGAVNAGGISAIKISNAGGGIEVDHLQYGDVGAQTDCNNNGVPDECELPAHDCNSDGIPDSCDIANGLSQDANSNGVPDECDLFNSSALFFVAGPPATVVLPGPGSANGLADNTTVASPPAKVVLPAPGTDNGLADNTTVASPPVSVVLPAPGDENGLPPNTTAASPPVTVILPTPGDENGLTPNTTSASPPVTVVLPGPGDENGLPPNTTPASPPVKVVLPAPGDANGLPANTTVAYPPCGICWTTLPCPY